GKKISGLFINRPERDNVGLFGYVGGSGTITGVGLVDTEVQGHFSVGVLVGTNEGSVLSSFATGSVSGDTDIGGLVGFNDGGNITDSYATVNVTGNIEIGGLVGYSWGGTIMTSYAM